MARGRVRIFVGTGHGKTPAALGLALMRASKGGHAVGKAVFFLQQADHYTAGNGADAAEKEGDEARVPQAGVPLFHRILLAVFGGAASVVILIKAYSGQKARAAASAEEKSAPSGSASPFGGALLYFILRLLLTMIELCVMILYGIKQF